MEGPASNNQSITLNFSWEGPTTWGSNVFAKSVSLEFPQATTAVSVALSEQRAASTSRYLPFTCKKPLVGPFSVQTTTPNALKVTIEKVKGLVLTILMGEKGRSICSTLYPDGKVVEDCPVRLSKINVKLEVPEKLQPNQKYTLHVTSNHNLDFSAQLVKIIETSPSIKVGGGGRGKAEVADFKQRLNNFGDALISEGQRNLDAALAGNVSPNIDEIIAAALAGIVGAGKEMHPAITKPVLQKNPLSHAQLASMSVSDLRKLFEEALIQDKQYEVDRMRASIAGNIQEMNKIHQNEINHSQCVVKIAQTLEAKGIQPQIPNSAQFRELAAESARLQNEALGKITRELSKK